jgi:RNA polymerase-binding transcription factor DksA
MGLFQTASVEMASFGDCITCGSPIWGPATRKTHCLNKKGIESFYCINGHSQVYVGETESQKLQKQLDRVTKEKEWAEQSKQRAQEAEATARRAEAIAKGKLKAQATRIKNGVCPCCNRSFANLHRHMSTKHPTFGGDGT